MKTTSSKNKINIITLGCSKNLVDSEVLMGQLQAGKLEVVHDSNDTDARTVVINKHYINQSIVTYITHCNAPPITGIVYQRYGFERQFIKNFIF